MSDISQITEEQARKLLLTDVKTGLKITMCLTVIAGYSVCSLVDNVENSLVGAGAAAVCSLLAAKETVYDRVKYYLADPEGYMLTQHNAVLKKAV
jgi:hypothetical protein